MSAASAQGLTAGTIRTNMSNPTHTIKVAAGTTPQQTQAIFNALQQVSKAKSDFTSNSSRHLLQPVPLFSFL